jgi:hypothetical protein
VATNCQSAKQRPAKVENSVVYVDVGEATNLSCSFDAEISMCNFAIPSFKGELKLNPKWKKGENNYFYYGDGLDKGQCGITLDKVTTQMSGNVTCRLDMNDGEPDAFGTITLIVFDPTVNRIMTTSEATKAGETFTAACPLVKKNKTDLFWFLNNNEINHAEGVLLEVTDFESKVSFALQPGQDGSRLYCRAYHPKFAQTFEDIETILQVKFAPQSLETPNDFLLKAGEDGRVNAKFTANPKPDILWFFNGTPLNKSEETKFLISELAAAEGKNSWEASIVLKETVVDAANKLELKVKNEIGEETYDIYVQFYGNLYLFS